MTVHMSPPETKKDWSGRGLSLFESRRGKILAAIAIPVAAMGAAGSLLAFDPNEPGHYPTCPSLTLTDTYCPGCGAMRACRALLTGDPAEALTRNPLILVAAPYLLLAYVAFVAKLSGRRVPSSTQIPPWIMYTLLGLIAAFWIARNIPGWTWLSPE